MRGLARQGEDGSRARVAADATTAPKVALLLAACLLFASVLAFHELGARPLFSPAEARFGLAALEMLERGDWIQPRLNHVRYYEKPPLLLWSVGASYAVFGVNEFAARLPSALAYVGAVGATFAIALVLWGPRAAVVAALVYATSMGPFLFGRFLSTDSLLVFFLSLSLLGAVLLVKQIGGWLAPLLLYLGMFLGGMTKGLPALLFPTATVLSYALVHREDGFFRRLRIPLGCLLFAAVFLPWHVLVALRDPSFAHFYVVDVHLCRFLNCREAMDYVPASVIGFLTASLLWFLPWSFFLPLCLPRWRGTADRGETILWIWAAWVIGFFTLAGGRLEYYALPAYPALALLTGRAWSRLFDSTRRNLALEIPAWIVAGAAPAVLALTLLSTQDATPLLRAVVTTFDAYYREYFEAFPERAFSFTSEALALARPFSIALLVLGTGAVLATRRLRWRLAFALWIAGIVPLLVTVDHGVRMISAERSQRDLAEIVRSHWTEDSELVVAGRYEDRAGMTFYTRRPTLMLNAPVGILAFGHRQGDAPELFLSEEQFARKWIAASRVFLLADRSFAPPSATPLAATSRDVLYTNIGPALALSPEGPEGANP